MKKTTLLFFGLSLSLQAMCQLNSAFTVNTGNWYTGNSYQSKLAKDLGASTAGQDGGKFNWRDIQTNINSAAYNWTYTDSVVRALQSQGIDLFVTLRSVVPTNSVNSNTCSTNYTSSGSYWSWFPIGNDTVKWKQFITAVVDRYDMNGSNDMPGLINPVNKWRVETEWEYYWCGAYPKDSIAAAIEFVKLVNMTYDVIKIKQPSSVVSFAGIDSRHDKVAFNDGYTGEPFLCSSQNCVTTQNITTAQFNNPSSPVYLLKSRTNMLYLLKNAKYDELDIHQYGRWKYIPDAVRWLRDSANVTKPIDFLEGGGPYCNLCEISSTQAQLIRWNSSYVVYYFITGLANKIKRLSWHISPEYKSFSASFGDLDLMDTTNIPYQYVKRPSYFTYRFLAKNIFANIQSDSVKKITESNPNLYHYQVQPLLLDVAWSTNAVDSIIVSGSGTLYTWDIPITASDTTINLTTYSVSSSHTIYLNNNVPVFYSWNNPLGIIQTNAQEGISVNIYPNPSSNLINIDIYDLRFENHDLKIIDVVGKIVYQQMLNSKHESLNLNLPNGMYFLQLKSETGVVTRKIIIQK